MEEMGRAISAKFTALALSLSKYQFTKKIENAGHNTPSANPITNRKKISMSKLLIKPVHIAEIPKTTKEITITFLALYFPAAHPPGT
ncbi:hypothetical protein SRABI133_05005 [Peribacillus simplex]|uniref:Uncharacterized protein n=1 Tax=Peribacillus simplex TaxID=1478 RepID=A0A9W4PLA6_9BACI|nr:hypothetical protein SRABI133_05005 [Peribacillus simplex]